MSLWCGPDSAILTLLNIGPTEVPGLFTTRTVGLFMEDTTNPELELCRSSGWLMESPPIMSMPMPRSSD